ncbi:MAG: type II toxin-antitoxin system VapB family antitoxin [Rhodothermales bacterium]
MGRTNIHIDDELIETAMQMTGAKSKREAVDIALRRLVEKGTLYKAIRNLRGKLAWDGDVESWRSSRSQDQ